MPRGAAVVDAAGYAVAMAASLSISSISVSFLPSCIIVAGTSTSIRRLPGSSMTTLTGFVLSMVKLAWVENAASAVRAIFLFGLTVVRMVECSFMAPLRAQQGCPAQRMPGGLGDVVGFSWGVKWRLELERSGAVEI